MYLVDSGGQYNTGTTDVTRTVHVGTPTAEQREDFTHVLKAHIGLATVVGFMFHRLSSTERQLVLLLVT
ncbi:unnamed protein product [Dibothriocephalus latus]|uniref:Peptidase M24 domain-containing protein n=1 Tax=Dibothriocephalus latus TaxID=60516 RepID=A0A3P6QZN5_DIBLA|nr:unnamed protein product [Dibothriocephalus latus]